jgi:hypothetical protein
MPRPGRAQREFERECVDFFAETVQLFGVPKSVGQIYGLLYASPAPLGFSDIVERLEISKGSASQGLQLLRTLGAINVFEEEQLASVHRLPSTGAAVRGVAYLPELSLRKLISGVLHERVKPLASAGSDRLARLRSLVEQDEQESDFYLDRVEQLETWRRKLKTVLPILTALLGPKSKK